MAQGSKKSYTDKQKRKAEHIEEGYKEKGTSSKKSERIVWATVNKEDGGGKKSGTSKKSKTANKATKAKTTKSKTKKTSTKAKTTLKSKTKRKK